MPILLLLLLIFLVIVIIIAASRSKSKDRTFSDTCETDKDCGNLESCVYDPETKQSQCVPADKKFCVLDPPTELQSCECELDENGNCKNSETTCEKCLNSPAFSCISVTPEKPYVWKQGTKNVYIPNSPTGYGWCLPNVVNKNVTCNPFTSDYVLAQVGPNEYEWGCYCKHENLFDHSQGPLSDCTNVKACRTSHGAGPILGNLFVPHPESNSCKQDSDCSTGQKCLSPYSPEPCGYDYDNKPVQNMTKVDCKDPNSKCVCHVPWQGEEIVNNVDPLSGQCVCNKIEDKQLQYQCVVRSNDYFEMNCVQGFCDPFNTDSSSKCNQNQCFGGSGNCTCCNCPKGYIRCPDDIPSTNIGLITYCMNNGPMCVLDPCSTAEVPDGYYDPTLPGCVCPGDTCISQEDESSAIGQICIDACKGNGPCANRGKCIVPSGSKSYNDAVCCDCVPLWTNEGDKSCTCSKIAKNKRGKDKRLVGFPCCEDDDCYSGECTGRLKGVDCILGLTSGICGGKDGPLSPCSDTPCAKPNVCPDNSTVCPKDNMCCKTDSGFSCCPYPNGACSTTGKTCCPENYTSCGDVGCCPPDHPKCDADKKVCTTNDDKDPIPMQYIQK